jgi:hypothetical protein
VTSTSGAQVGRNEKCPCGSGRKYKQCCLQKDEEKARKAREKAEAKAAKDAEKARKAAEKAGEAGETGDDKDAAANAAQPQKSHKPQTHQPWKKSATNTHAFHKVTTPRKVGGS